MVKPELDVSIDYYSLLNVTIRADNEEIKRQYRKLALLYHPDRNIGQEEKMVEKFQLLQMAHEVLSDPVKRATYDRTRLTKIKISPSTPTKNRYSRPTAANNGFSKTTPRSGGPNGSKPAFGHFTTKEPPWSARRPPPRATTSNGAAKSAEKEKAGAYFNRFKEKTSGSNNATPQRQTAQSAFTSTRTEQQKKAEAQKAAGVKTPERKRAGFGSTFVGEETSEEETFYSFGSDGTGKTHKSAASGGAAGTGPGGWSERRTAYSHVYAGVKEDLRSPLKANGPSPTGFASDGFKTPRKENSNSSLNGTRKDGGGSDGTSEVKGFNFKANVPGQTLFGFGIHDQQFQNTSTAANGINRENNHDANGGFTNKEDDVPTPPLFGVPPGPARRKTSQQHNPLSTDSTPPDRNAIPKTPPPVEDRRFASAFSRLNVNNPNPSPTKTTPSRKVPPVNIDDWTKKFEGFNPFMSPATQKLSEDKNFWSSVPLGQTAKGVSPARRGKRVGKKGLGDMGDMKNSLPKMEMEGKGPGETIGGARGMAPVFRFNASEEKQTEGGGGVAFQFPVQQNPEASGFAMPSGVPPVSVPPFAATPVSVPPFAAAPMASAPLSPVISFPPVSVHPIPPAVPVVPLFEPTIFPPTFEPMTPQKTRQQPTHATTPHPPPAAAAAAEHLQQQQPYPAQTSTIPTLRPPTPPKRLIPRPSKPTEFSFSVPPLAEMQSLAREVQQYHIAFVTERARFDEAWKAYESTLRFWDEMSVRKYLEVNERISRERAEMEGLHRLCLERWGAVAKFSGFTG